MCLKAEEERDAAIAERDRLRRELEALRETLALNVPHYPAGAVSGASVIASLDAILRGES